MLILITISAEAGKSNKKKTTRVAPRRANPIQVPVASRRRRADQSIASSYDHLQQIYNERSFAEWQAVTPSVLQLIANENRIHYVSIADLPLNLFNHFQSRIGVIPAIGNQLDEQTHFGNVPVAPVVLDVHDDGHQLLPLIDTSGINQMFGSDDDIHLNINSPATVAQNTSSPPTTIVYATPTTGSPATTLAQ